MPDIAPSLQELEETVAQADPQSRETVRRLSNALQLRSARVPAHSSSELASSHRHRPLT